jgi:D-alanyl-D-alanine dipeptidase
LIELLRRIAISTAVLALAANASANAGPLTQAGFKDVTKTAPGVALDIRYATRNNFTGEVLPGYCKPLAMLRRPAATDLNKARKAAKKDGYGLLIYDAYRPARATRAMVEWAQRSGNEWVLNQGYVARRSNHNRGAAIDLTLTKNGKPVGMGTKYDAFTSRSHTANAKGTALKNRLRLKRYMESAGFRNYDHEWWHYDHPRVSAGAADLPLGC